nr:immunoglobulin heavy chain junction region [Macaca mulatta]
CGRLNHRGYHYGSGYYPPTEFW